LAARAALIARKAHNFKVARSNPHPRNQLVAVEFPPTHSHLNFEVGSVAERVKEGVLSKRDAEIVADDRRFRKEEEIEDIEIFLEAYERATGEALRIEDIDESPDAICIRPDGTLVGVEHTRVRRSPDAAHWDSVFHRRDEMDVGETLDEIARLIAQKAERRKNFSTSRNILFVALYESGFDVVVQILENYPSADAELAGFDEIWLADFKGVRDGAHRETRLFGLFPDAFGYVTDRSSYDQKPYG
jgi:hypothetical protein